MVDRQLTEFALYESCHSELDKEDKPRKQTYETEFDNLSVGVTYSINRMGMKSLPTETMHNIEMIIEEEEEKVWMGSNSTLHSTIHQMIYHFICNLLSYLERSYFICLAF